MPDVSKNTSVMIATPTLGTVHTAYVQSLLGTMSDLQRGGIPCSWDTVYGAHDGLPLGRNLLASRFLKSTATHLFCVDSDIEWPANLCSHMIGCDKPVIGVVYPTKSFDAKKAEAAAARGMSFTESMRCGYDWVVSLPDDKTFQIHRGLMRVKAIGFGAVLIQRHVLETMAANGMAPKQDGVAGDLPYYNFFTQRTGGVTVGEDFSFCDRWIKDCGGEVFALTNTEIYHHGDFRHGGSYLQHLQATSRRGVAIGGSRPASG